MDAFTAQSDLVLLQAPRTLATSRHIKYPGDLEANTLRLMAACMKSYLRAMQDLSKTSTGKEHAGYDLE